MMKRGERRGREKGGVWQEGETEWEERRGMGEGKKEGKILGKEGEG